MSISAKSAASTPPASARIVTSASRWSYSPDSRVRTSSSPRVLRIDGSSAWASAQGVGVALVLGQLEEHREVVQPAAQRLDPVELTLQVREPAGHLLRVLLVVPEVGGGGLLVEVGQVAAHRVQVEDRLDAAQGLVELLELLGHVHGCHVQEDVRDRADGRPRRSLVRRASTPCLPPLLPT